MKLNASQLARHLQQGPLAPVYVISGDEPLLCQEACDAVRAACRQQDFSERQVLHADASFDWNILREAGASLSLFAERRLLELRLPGGKPGDAGTAALLDYLARPAEDTVLLISLPRLDSKTQKSKWARALIEDRHSQFVAIWPVETAQLPQWLQQRLAQAGLSATAEALDLLVARTEGNLLAAVQEVEKLRLLAEGPQLDAATVQASVADSARFDLFSLLDAALAGEQAHALRMLGGLRAEGVEAPVILWGLTRELRLLAGLLQQQARGVPSERAIAQLKPPLFGKRPALVGRALQRLSLEHCTALLCQAQQIDEQIKGQAPGNPWNGLAALTLQLAGGRLPLGSS